MALRKNELEAPRIYERFGIAQDEPIPGDVKLRQATQASFRARIFEASKYLNETAEDSRELSLALTKLEEALMWGGKAIFK